MYRAFFFISLLCFQFSGLCQESNFFSLQNRKAFADYLFCEKDYLRASEEYAAVNNASLNDSLSFKIGLCFLKMSDLEKAENVFSKLNSSSLADESKLLQLKIYFLQHKNILEQTVNTSFEIDNPELKTASRRLQLAAQIKAGIRNQVPLIENYFDKSDSKMLNNFAKNFSDPEKKNPFAAALFSAVIPGTGKIYTGNFSDGITSLVVTGLFAFLTLDNIQAHHATRAWIFAGLTSFFYYGNIYGSYISARNYNLEKEDELLKDFDTYLQSKNYFIPEEIEGKCK